MYHYTYQIYDPVLDMFYIGVHSSPSLDDGYMGSLITKEWKSQWKEITARSTKTILATWDTREEAVAHEILLHDCFDVGVNPKFFNGAKQKATGFDFTGRKHREDTIEVLKKLVRDNVKSGAHNFISNHPNKDGRIVRKTNTKRLQDGSHTFIKDNPTNIKLRSTFDGRETNLCWASRWEEKDPRYTGTWERI